MEELICDVQHRPFDRRRFFFHSSLVWRTAELVMKQFIGPEHHNLGLIATKQTRDPWAVFATTAPITHKALAAYDINTLFPLYLYANGKVSDGDLFVHENPTERRRPNFSAAFIEDFCKRLKVKFVSDGLGEPSKHTIGPELIFNYAYAIFHSRRYRERYAEFLRSDFPRLPITSDYKLFQELAAFGGRLVDLQGAIRQTAAKFRFL